MEQFKKREFYLATRCPQCGGTEEELNHLLGLVNLYGICGGSLFHSGSS